jgi:trimeric autotransporter adhesin
MTIKTYWIAAITAGILSAGAVAQTSASSSASGNASVSPGQAGAGVSASQSAQTSGASANVDANANANAKASHEQEGKSKDNKNKGSNSGASGSGSAAGTGDLSAGLTSGTALQAELTKPVDAKKAKSGDEVSAKLTQDVKSNGKVVLHKGSKLVGHVTEAQAKNKENAESKLGIVFDRAVLKGGQEVSFNSVIQAVAPPLQATGSLAADEGSNLGGGMGGGGGMGRTSPGGSPLGGAVSGVTNTAGSAVGGVGNTAGGVTSSTTGAVGGSVNNTVGAAANGTLNTTSRGVIGMQGLALNTAAAGSAQGSVISSATQNVKLDSGTRMVLQVAGSAAAK